ncbi:MAG: hypothetical protein M3065_15435 [Actinomycetota bacterium]|nr:hypothetical protein [Actinomycetota bacterium]
MQHEHRRVQVLPRGRGHMFLAAGAALPGSLVLRKTNREQQVRTAHPRIGGLLLAGAADALVSRSRPAYRRTRTQEAARTGSPGRYRRNE